MNFNLLMKYGRRRNYLPSLEKISKEEYNAPECSGHGSIRDTLAHCLSAEQGWFLWFDKSMSVSESMVVTEGRGN